ncbi:MAG: NifU family protein [Acidimicrobiia bacterium]|nr:NifU family protein [Acidimicrobiia bacterium]
MSTDAVAPAPPTDDAVTTDASAADEAVMIVTDDALVKVLEVRAGEDDAEQLALRIEITGANGAEFTYDLAFETVDEAAPDDHRQIIGPADGDHLVLHLPADSVERLRGATLDLPSHAGQGGLVIRNPNRPDPLADVGDLELEGDTPDKVRQLLEQVINPSLASHGGFATLVGVEGSTAYVTMGGGCQGCAMSQATMVQGIATAVCDAIPEITDVVDATDHTQGENPFYT